MSYESLRFEGDLIGLLSVNCGACSEVTEVGMRKSLLRSRANLFHPKSPRLNVDYQFYRKVLKLNYFAHTLRAKKNDWLMQRRRQKLFFTLSLHSSSSSIVNSRVSAARSGMNDRVVIGVDWQRSIRMNGGSTAGVSFVHSVSVAVVQGISRSVLRPVP